MRSALALMLVLAVPGAALAQTPPPQPAPTQPTPAPAAPPRPRAPRPAAPSTATAVLTITVNDATGAPLADVTVTTIGPVEREGITTAAGQVRLLGIRAGTYRVRFEREGFYTFEKEVSWRAGTPAPVSDATLTAAPPPPPPPPVPEPAKLAAATHAPDLPAGKPGNLSVINFLERNELKREPQREDLIGCSGGASTWVWQIREPWLGRKHDSAELMLYIIGGEGTMSIEGRDIQVAASTFAVVPRGTTYGLTRRGRAPALYVLATLSGPPCAQ